MRKLAIFGLFLSLFALGFLREFIFENINILLGNKWTQIEVDEYWNGTLNWLDQFDYWTLYYSKWALTLLSSILFLGLSLALIWKWFGNRRNIKYALLAFVGLYLASAILMGAGWAFGDANTAYTYARVIMEIPQSPLLAMFLIPVFLLMENSR